MLIHRRPRLNRTGLASRTERNLSGKKLGKLVSYFLLLIFVPCGLTPAQVTQSDKDSDRLHKGGIDLPSFSIFGSPLSGNSNKMDDWLNPEGLDLFLATAEKYQNTNYNRQNGFYWIIPEIFYSLRHIFAKDSWTSEEIKQVQVASDFFARLAKSPDLKISVSDRQEFRAGLIRLRDWFSDLCQDNKTLAAMIFTLNSGPFFREEIEIPDTSEATLIGAISIPGQEAKFVLMNDRRNPEPMLIGVRGADGNIRWLKKYSAAPQGKITAASIEDNAIVKLDGYGYLIRVAVEWRSRKEHSFIYLDQSLNLRFYYLSQ